MATTVANGGFNSHFNWNLNPDGSKDNKSVIEQIEIHLADQTNLMTVPALLFKAYLYMSDYVQPHQEADNEAKASVALDEAEDEIKDMKDDNAKVGLLIVHHSLAGILRGQRKDNPTEERRYLKEIHILETRKNGLSDAYIDVTRAFALSRLGPAKIKECCRYFDQALQVWPDNIEWLLYFGIMYGRNARIIEGIPRKETMYTRKEREMYEQVLRLDPKHSTANLFMGQVLFHEGRESEATRYFEMALKFAPDDMRVLNRSAKFYRQTYNWTNALKCISKIIGLKHTTPDAMMYHQLALVYVGKYKGIIRGKQVKPVVYLPKETDDPKSLLPLALEAINKAINLNNAVVFGFDRAWIYEKMGKQDEADKEYQRLLKLFHHDKPQDNVQIFIQYGQFLIERRPEDAMNMLKQGIEMAVTQCTERTEDNQQRFHGRIAMLTKNAIQTYKKHNEMILANYEDPVAFKNLGWLKLVLGNVEKSYTDSRPAMYYYEKAYRFMPQDADESFITEVLQGLIDCHLLKGRHKDFQKAREYIRVLMKTNETAGRRKLDELKRAEDNQHDQELVSAFQAAMP